MLTSGGFTMRRAAQMCRGALPAVALLSGLALASQASAATVYAVSGGPGLDQGQLCVTGVLCPGNPSYQWVSGGAVSGTISYDQAAGTASFSFTLTQDASFGAETLLSGSTFSANNISVSLSALGPAQQITQTGGPVSGSASLQFNPGLAMTQATPNISGFSCTLGFGTNLCGVSLGSTGLVVGPDNTGKSYSTFLTFNVAVTPVPLPAALPLLLSGLGAAGAFMRRRRQG